MQKLVTLGGKRIILFVLLFSLTLTATLLYNQTHSYASVEEKVNSNLSDIQAFLSKQVELRSDLAYSSNPYDYIKGNESFNKILELGNDALPVLQSKIENSSEDGLQEYIAAIAIERISKTDLKSNDSTKWETAKGFTGKWRSYLKEIPSKVTAVSNSKTDTESKIRSLVALGTPAIPFIIDEVESGKSDLFPALLALNATNENVADIKDWATQHKSNFNALKEYVVNQ